MPPRSPISRNAWRDPDRREPILSPAFFSLAVIAFAVNRIVYGFDGPAMAGLGSASPTCR